MVTQQAAVTGFNTNNFAPILSDATIIQVVPGESQQAPDPDRPTLDGMEAIGQPEAAPQVDVLRVAELTVAMTALERVVPIAVQTR